LAANPGAAALMAASHLTPMRSDNLLRPELGVRAARVQQAVFRTPTFSGGHRMSGKLRRHAAQQIPRSSRVNTYVPTSSSWLNLIERWFGELTSKRIRRDSFLSVDDLIAAINEFLAAWNENPRPFVWTATVESILAKLARCRQTLEQIQPGCTAPKTRKRKSS